MADTDVNNQTVEGIAELDLAVKNLFDTRNCYFNNHPIETASQKKEVVNKVKDETLAVVSKLETNETVAATAQFLFLKGKTYNVAEEYDALAELALSKAVKLNPKHVEGWNELGECFWKKRDLVQARTCFESALKLEDNKISFRSLSMLLRQVGTSDLEKNNNIDESLKFAKNAIKADATDGHSWFVLGNTYLAMFFARMETVEHVKQALKAYKKAETDKTEGTNNPDLHMNRATIHRYQEDYAQAIEGFQLAALLDPGWPEPTNALQQLQEKLERINTMIAKKGGFKAKKLTEAMDMLKLTDDENEHKTISNLKDNINDLCNIRLHVMTVFSQETLPQTYCAIDREGSWVCVTVYNMEQGAIQVNDTIEIPEPYFRAIKLQTVSANKSSSHEAHVIEFNSIRVDNPVTLKVGGLPLGEGRLTKATLTVTTMAN